MHHYSFLLCMNGCAFMLDASSLFVCSLSFCLFAFLLCRVCHFLVPSDAESYEEESEEVSEVFIWHYRQHSLTNFPFFKTLQLHVDCTCLVWLDLLVAFGSMNLQSFCMKLIYHSCYLSVRLVLPLRRKVAYTQKGTLCAARLLCCFGVLELWNMLFILEICLKLWFA